MLGVFKMTKDRVTFMAGEHFGECEERAELLATMQLDPVCRWQGAQ